MITNLKQLTGQAHATLSILEEAKKLLTSQIISLIAVFAKNEPVTFDEETGFPTFSDNDNETETVFAVRVTERNNKPILELNSSCGDNDYGLDPNGWFNPDDFGTYSPEELLDCIETKIGQKFR